MACRQAGLLEPADDVLGSHFPQRIPDGVIEVPLHPCRDPTEEFLDLRVHLLDRGIVRAVRRQREDARPGSLDGLDTAADRWAERLSNTTTSPSCKAGA